MNVQAPHFRKNLSAGQSVQFPLPLGGGEGAKTKSTRRRRAPKKKGEGEVAEKTVSETKTEVTSEVKGEAGTTEEPAPEK